MNLINVAHAGVITDAPSIADIGTGILFFLLSVAGIIAIISLVLSGVKYLLANGDNGRMQSAKRSASYAILGIILAMGGMVLMRLLGQFFK